ncbi:MAG: lysophospholipid transporter LplT [Methylibium sp.]|uniref:lysophospholipid transporter LplT n=2 Tax=unclassified Methylibium TaxID=2633235 RepID=UPI0003F3EF89|nr:lysophospholipid transporter LplT [Methylibium sp. T29-B]EWS58331.1 Lysophospholipid transporter LplT [Methylibium sp. T29-B]
MPTGFHVLIAAQFVSGLADNALLIVTIARLDELGAPLWWAPLLKLGFTLAYVLLAPFVGALADAWPKARVMFVSNGLKAGACALLVAGGDPLLAFTLAGIGAAAYSPAKYGLVTELLPPARLVAANGWIEVCTVGAILLGTALGGLLVSPSAQTAAPWLPPLAQALPTGGTQLLPALLTVLALFVLAGVLNLCIPDSGARYPRVAPGRLLRQFADDNGRLWRDPAGRVSLAVTTLFWGVGATLQFVVLRWAEHSLGLDLHEAAGLQIATALGLIAGAVAAGRWLSLPNATRVLPLGIAMGLLVPWMTVIEQPFAATPLLAAVGACAGFFVVPMNALLQHRGHTLLSAGRSIAVQNFNENLGVLALLALYAALTAAGLPLALLIWGFGALVALATAAITALHRRHASLGAHPAPHRNATPENA